MQTQSIPTGSACINCGATGLVDENARCERCVMDADRHAIALQNIEDALVEGSESGLTDAQLREAQEQTLANRAGSLTGTLAARGLDSDGRGFWDLEAPSAFQDDDGGARNRLRKFRRSGNYTLDELADELGVSATDVALWEIGAPVPEEPLERLCELFGVSAIWLLGEEG